jgi:hypothetical protein
MSSIFTKLLEFSKKECVNLFTIVYFGWVALLVWQNNNADEQKDTINSIIQNDIDKYNGTTTLFDNLIRLINGETLKARSSLFSFKQVQYSLKDRGAFQPRQRSPFQASSYDDQYSFYLTDRVVVINGHQLDSMSISDLSKFDENVDIIHPKTHLYFRYAHGFRGHPFGEFQENSAWRTLAIDADGSTKYLARSSPDLTSFISSASSFSWVFTMDHLYTFRRDNHLLYCTPFGPEKDSGSIKPTQFLNLADQFDQIRAVIPEDGSIAVVGEKNNKDVITCYATGDFTPLKNSIRFPIFGGSNYLEEDGKGNLAYYLGQDSIYYLPAGELRRFGIGRLSMVTGVLQEIDADATLYLLAPLSIPRDTNYALLRYTLFKATLNDSDSLSLKKLSDKNFRRNPVVFRDMLLLEELGSDTLKPYRPDGYPKPLHGRDSSLLALIEHHTVLYPNSDKEGLFLFPLNVDAADFLVLHRSGSDEITASFVPGKSWNIGLRFFDFAVVYDYYYLVIFTCIIIVLYYLVLIGLHQLQHGRAQRISEPPNAAVPSEDYKLQLTYHSMESLRKRSDIMLRLGIAFGVFGVLVSAFVFQNSNLNLGPDWRDPHTFLGLLKPMVILLFMETFTFYFLKQYRIIFNEYKLYYSIFLDLLSTNSMVELESRKDLDPGLLKHLMDKISKVRYDMYEKETKEKIKEFNEVDLKSLTELVEKLKSGG